jgi:hypothetical protein
MVARGEGGTGGIVVSSVGEEIVVWGNRDHLAYAFVWFVEPHSDKIRAICGGGGARSCAGDWLGRVSGIFKVEEGIGEMWESIRDAHSSSFNNIDVVAAVGSDSRSDVEGTGRVVIPSETCEGGLMNVAELASWEYGVGREVVWEMGEAVISGEGRVRVPRLQVVEGDFDKRKEGVPHIEGEGDV